MGKPLISQKRGKGSPTYRVQSKGLRVRSRYSDEAGKVVDILLEAGRNAPVARILYPNGKKEHIIAPYGIKVGDTTEDIVVPISQVPESGQVFGIETYPNSGPKLCMAPGSFAILVSKTEKECIIKLPSKKTKSINPNCRVTIGVPAGSGRSDKPWTKAGKKWIAMHRRGKLYPRTSGVCMNAVDHPFGGSTRVGKPMSVSRHAPPGRKVGAIAPKRTGRKRGK